jgi:RNA polymerase sigma factor (TIGR02999 family)
MGPGTAADITGLLQAWSRGEHKALEQLAPLVDRELRQIAMGLLRRMRPGGEQAATSLVNEAYMHLIGAKQLHWEERKRFYALAARIMRGILVDEARARGAAN